MIEAQRLEQSLVRCMVAAFWKWIGVILVNQPAFDQGRKLSKTAPLGAILHSGLTDVFAGKAAGTLHGRVGPMVRFVALSRALWLFPFARDVYDFV